MKKNNDFTIVLWKEPEKEGTTIDEVLDESMSIFNYLDTLPNWIKPFNTYNEKDFDKINLSNEEEIREKLLKGVKTSDIKTIENFGYYCVLFSNEDDCGNRTSWAFNLGNTISPFVNSIVIHFYTSSFNSFKNNQWQTIICEIFVKLTALFQAFYGTIENNYIGNDYPGFITESIPNCVYGYNYWNKDMIERIGMERIIQLVELGKIEYEEPGFIKLFDGFVDVFDDEQMKKRKEIEDYLLYNDETIFKRLSD